MTMDRTALVLGATGGIGGEVAKLLLAQLIGAVFKGHCGFVPG